jgi:hypothetical protein
MARTPDINFNQRFAVVGKTRSGKSTYALILACLLVPFVKKTKNSDVEVWWADTKHDPRDIEALKKWGFTTDPKAKSNYRLFHIVGNKEEKVKQWESAQKLFQAAYERCGVLVVVDEYRQVVPNTVNAGDDLLDLFTRGGGRGAGVIGETQEPVYVPRQLLSQATHQMFFDLSYPNDIKRIQEFYAPYDRPLITRGNNHGFFHVAVDYDGLGVYYPHVRNWVESNGLMQRVAA